MNKNCAEKLPQKLILLLILSLIITMFGCASEKKPRVKRSDASSDETLVEENSKDVAVVQNNPTNSIATSTKSGNSSSTSKSSANVFQGTWEKEEQGQPFRYEVFGPASKQGDVFTGRITDQRNVVVADYKVFNNSTIEIAYLPAFYGGQTFTHSYKVSDGGNKITLDASPPIIYTKGKSNTTIQTDAAKLANVTWNEAGNASKTLVFSGASQSGAGWTGTYAFMTNGLVDDEGTFKLSKSGEITISSYSGGSDNFKYSIRNNDKILDLSLPRKGTTITYSR